MESIHKMGEQHGDMPTLPDDIQTNEELYGYTASTMEVKMQSGQTKEESTVPYLLRYLPKYKAPGCIHWGSVQALPGHAFRFC